MNYYKELFFHCTRIVFNHFKDPYCSKWDSLLSEIIEFGTVEGFSRDSTGDGIFTIEFVYEGTRYSVWVSNGFYAIGCLWGLNKVAVKGVFQRRPSFDVQFTLARMVEDHKNTLNSGTMVEFESKLYKV